MIPISRLKDLPDEINLNPFEIYIVISLYTPQGMEIQKRISNILEKHPLIGQIFRVKYISKEIFTGGVFSAYYKRVLANNNIMARVIRPASDMIRIELGNIWLCGSEEHLSDDLVAFLYQLCKTDIEEVSQVIIDAEFSSAGEQIANSLEFLYEIENAFRDLASYLRNIMRENSFLRLRQNQKRNHKLKSGFSQISSVSGMDKLPELPHILHKISGEMTPIEAKATAVGFDVMTTNFALDRDLIITLLPPSEKTRFPRLSFSLFGQSATTNRGYKDGLFLYVCGLVEYVNGRIFYKNKLTEVLEQFKQQLNGVPEREALLRHVEITGSLNDRFHYFQSIYEALFRTQWDKHHAPEYVDSQSFKEWCIRIAYNNRDPFNQGLSNLRRNISDAMASIGIGYLASKVNMKSPTKDLRPYILPGNIYFPATESWRELVPSENIIRSNTLNTQLE